MLTLDTRYYLNADKTRAMSQDELDEQAKNPPEDAANVFEPAFLLGGPGTLISEEDAERLGIADDLEEADLAKNKAVMRAVNGLPNRADLNVAQLLPEDRTALQKVADIVNEQDEKKARAAERDRDADLAAVGEAPKKGKKRKAAEGDSEDTEQQQS
jgi:hypothetical protein